MRVMVLVKADKNSEAGVLPDEKRLREMGNYNEQLVKAGVMLAGEGLQPSSKGERVRFSGNKRTVIDGPFPETKEPVAGYWIWQLNSMEEAIEWVKRSPTRRAARIPRSRSARSTRRTISARNTRPSFERRKSASARKWPGAERFRRMRHPACSHSTDEQNGGGCRHHGSIRRCWSRPRARIWQARGEGAGLVARGRELPCAASVVAA